MTKLLYIVQVYSQKNKDVLTFLSCFINSPICLIQLMDDITLRSKI